MSSQKKSLHKKLKTMERRGVIARGYNKHLQENMNNAKKKQFEEFVSKHKRFLEKFMTYYIYIVFPFSMVAVAYYITLLIFHDTLLRFHDFDKVHMQFVIFIFVAYGGFFSFRLRDKAEKGTKAHRRLEVLFSGYAFMALMVFFGDWATSILFPSF